MAYTVKQADVLKDKDIMVNILQQNRNRENFDYSARYDWIYLQNPYGNARAWIIWDDKNDRPVGFTGVFPREVMVNGQKHLCWNCGDFSIEKKYRTLGVALKLRKAAKMAVDQLDVPFLYAHPNARMELIHLKAGHQKIAQMKRFALPIRINRLVGKKIKNRWLVLLLSKPVNLLLSFKYRFSTFWGLSCSLSQNVACSRDHEMLYQRMGGEFAVVGSRSVKYLNWKFGNNPNTHYHQFDMFYKGYLVGTVFFIRKGDTVHIIDMLIDDFRRFGSQLFRMFINEIRKTYRGTQSFSIILQEFNPFVEVIKKLGFRYRDDATSAVIVYANPKSELADVVMQGAKWYMTVGDRDA